MIPSKIYNVDLASLSDKKLMYDLAKEMYFDVKTQSIDFTRDRTLIKLPKPPGLMIPVSGFSNTIFYSSDPDELGERLKLLLQEKMLGLILI